MGTYTELTVAGYPLISSKSAVVPEVMTVFRETDRRVFKRRLSERNPLVWGESEPNDEVETAIEYSCETRNVIDRLNIMGFTAARAREEFEQGRQKELEECEGRAKDGDSHLLADLVAAECEVLKKLTFDEYSQGLTSVLLGGWRQAPFDDPNIPGLDPVVRYILDEHYDHPFGYLGGDVRLLLRLACGLVDASTQVVQDITDLVHAGYYGPDEPVCEKVIQELTAGHPENAPRIILTEGSSDGAILKAALSILYPHLAEYYSFVDFDSSRSAGGAGHLVSVVKAFAGAGITNRVIALFDNDTAAQEAVRTLEPVRLPQNIAVRHYPPLESLRNYPTLGPSGLTSLDVNGLAASIELYLGEDVLRDEQQELTPVQWRGYSDTLKRYQGEVGSKGRLRDRYNQKVARCQTDRRAVETSDWAGLDAILQTVFSAFDDA